MKTLLGIAFFLSTMLLIYFCFGWYWHHLDAEQELPDQILFLFFIYSFMITTFLFVGATAIKWMFFRKAKS